MVPPTSQIGQAYDILFFECMDRDARRSAKVVIPLLAQSLNIHSVIDFGCGTGEWLRVWKQWSAEQVVGVDGDFVDRESLRIDATEFLARDLRGPVDLQRRFDLVQSLEVAEHLPESCAESFVDTLVSHGDKILFSAAVPGQMGVQHINEQPYEYWRDKFALRGYVLLDWIRPQLAMRSEVAIWYRYNTLLFVHQSELSSLPAPLQESRVPAEQSVPDWSPRSYRFRCSLARRISVKWVDRIVRLAHHIENRNSAARTASAN